MQFDELLGQLVPRVEMDQRRIGLVGFAHAHRSGQVHRQYRQAFGDQFVKDLLRQARDYVKFIPQSAGASAEVKADAARVLAEIEQADRDILH